MNLEKYFAEKKRIIDEETDEILPGGNVFPETLSYGMRYALFPGGKRIRPILCLASCEAVGGDSSKIIRAACSIEFVHTFSLIHDDLPAIDNDDFRRGKPTLHKVIDEGKAILVGDALLSMTFEVLANLKEIGEDVKVRLIQELSNASGLSGIVAGQVVDIESEGKEVDAETLDYIHRNKTAALIVAAVRMGAIGGGASAEELDWLSNYGENIGLVYQIVDDILDVKGDEKALGKRVGANERLKKATYPSLYGIEKSREIASSLTEKAIGYLEKFDEKAEPLREIASFILRRKM